MKTQSFLLFATLAIITTSLHLRAQDWRWEADPTFFNPGLDSGLAAIGGYQIAGCLCDLNGDGAPEYILGYSAYPYTLLRLAESSGEFPDIHWRLREGFFGDQAVVDRLMCSVKPYDLDNDGSLELIFSPDCVLKNRGNYENPDWVRADDLFPDVEVEAERCTPNFCDWDGDNLLDLILCYDNGYFRYEKDGDGDWQALGFTEMDEEGWTIAAHIADLDGDGDQDIFGFYDMPCMWATSTAFLNLGTPDEPQWSDPIELEYWDHQAPFLYDLNDDGYPDIVDGWSYQLHTGQEGVAEWGRSVYWGESQTPLAAYDFNGDGSVELLCSFRYGAFIPAYWRLAQLMLSNTGWHDNLFFGEDYGDWVPGQNDIYSLSVIDLLETGNTQLALSLSGGMNLPPIVLMENRDEAGGWDWQQVEGFLDALVDTIGASQQLAFGDFDGDDDEDVAMLCYDYERGQWLTFFRNNSVERQPGWERMDGWGINYLDTISVNRIGAGDFDGDSRCDLIAALYAGNDPGKLLMFHNGGDQSGPRWVISDAAFAETGPDSAQDVVVADINLDGRPDLIVTTDYWASQTCYINESTSSAPPEVVLPGSFAVAAFPNPTNGAVSIRLTLPMPSEVAVECYDLNGRLVANWASRWMTPGVQFISHDVNRWSAGAYFGVVRAGREEYPFRVNVVK